jgi:hypothetical protein
MLGNSIPLISPNKRLQRGMKKTQQVQLAQPYEQN